MGFELNTITIALIAVIAVLFLVLHIVWGCLCSRIAGRKGYGTTRNFWFGFFLGLIAVVAVESRPPRTFVMNPTIKKELMYITWLRQVGALTDAEFAREKKILFWMNHYMS